MWFSPAYETRLEDLHLTYDATNPWWLRVKELTSALVKRYGGNLAVSHTDLGGNLDILASFRGTQELLLDLYDCPKQIDRLTRDITKLWLQYYDELDTIIRPACRGSSCWTPIFSTGKTYMLQSDFAYMISPAMFEEFVLPYQVPLLEKTALNCYGCCEGLEHRLEQLLRRLYGRSSERLDANQLLLFGQTMHAAPAPAPDPTPGQEAAPAPPRRKGHGRRPLPADLPRHRIEHGLQVSGR